MTLINHLKADLYRIFLKASFLVWVIALLVAPPLIINALSAFQPAEAISENFQVLLFVVFCGLALVISNYTIREDLRLGLLKNDMSCGVSRPVIYFEKVLCGALLMVFLWLLCSASCAASVAYRFGQGEAAGFLKTTQGEFALLTIARTISYMAILQALSLAFEKMPIVILVCVVMNTALTYAGRLAQLIVPSLSVPDLIQSALRCAAAIAFGTVVFVRKEL